MLGHEIEGSTEPGVPKGCINGEDTAGGSRAGSRYLSGVVRSGAIQAGERN